MAAETTQCMRHDMAGKSLMATHGGVATDERTENFMSFVITS